MYTYTKKEIVAIMKKQIANSDNKAIHALMTIYSMQDDNEKGAGRTINLNGIGFSGTDSKLLTSLAKQFDRDGCLSVKQLQLLKRIMPRYAGQLMRISFGKGNFERVGRKWRIVRKSDKSN